MKKNKFYILISLATLLLIFTVAASCTFCGTAVKVGEEDIEDQERRLESTRERYREQFTAMEEAMSQMQQQQSWMQQQLASLNTGGNMISSMM